MCAGGAESEREKKEEELARDIESLVDRGTGTLWQSPSRVTLRAFTFQHRSSMYALVLHRASPDPQCSHLILSAHSVPPLACVWMCLLQSAHVSLLETDPAVRTWPAVTCGQMRGAWSDVGEWPDVGALSVVRCGSGMWIRALCSEYLFVPTCLKWHSLSLFLIHSLTFTFQSRKHRYSFTNTCR
jgi:hypothetical protein